LFQPTGDGEDNFKLVLIVRSDLKMGKGKAAAQVQHVSWIMLQSIVDFSAE
jgi:peptidyl-tRNA hydrolase